MQGPPLLNLPSPPSNENAGEQLLVCACHGAACPRWSCYASHSQHVPGRPCT